MSKKEKILDAALKLFNTQGTDVITVRHIAAELEMSHGNLCYHYPTKDDIIYALYEKLVSELDSKIEEYDHKEITFKESFESSDYAIKVFYKYRFLMLDIVSIMRSIPKIKTHYRALMKKRNLQFKALFEKSVASGFMRKENFSGEYNTLIDLLSVIGDFWIAHGEIQFEGTDEQKISHYSKILFSAFSPYLTPIGWMEFMGVNK